MALPGAFISRKKDGTLYYRASITYKNKHISLGSFATEAEANNAYIEAGQIINSSIGVHDYNKLTTISYEKYIVLINFRDNNLYIKNPIYMMDRYFLYFLTEEIIFKFDIEDLFFYSTHKITARGGHYFVADYGMQINIHSKYGIKPHAVEGRDYQFVNGDIYDYRYENINIINKYHGVEQILQNNKIYYKVKIFFNSTRVVGTYKNETYAAIAYNKAADLIKTQNPNKNYELNYPDGISASEYARIYTKIKISKKLIN